MPGHTSRRKEEHMDTFPIQALIWPVIASYYIGKGARRYGYSGLLWAFVSLLASPILVMIFVTGLPNRKIEEQRQAERTLLDRQLEKRGPVLARGLASVPMHTISDDATMRSN